jgi:hypothetical protein
MPVNDGAHGMPIARRRPCRRNLSGCLAGEVSASVWSRLFRLGTVLRRFGRPRVVNEFTASLPRPRRARPGSDRGRGSLGGVGHVVAHEPVEGPLQSGATGEVAPTEDHAPELLKNRALQPLDEAIGPGMSGFRAGMAKAELATGPIKGSPLRAAVGEDAPHRPACALEVGHDDLAQERGGGHGIVGTRARRARSPRRAACARGGAPELLPGAFGQQPGRAGRLLPGHLLHRQPQGGRQGWQITACVAATSYGLAGLLPALEHHQSRPARRQTDPAAVARCWGPGEPARSRPGWRRCGGSPRSPH